MRFFVLIVLSSCFFVKAADRGDNQAVASNDGFVLISRSAAPPPDAFLAALEGSDGEGSDDDVVVSLDSNDLTSSQEKSKERSRLDAQALDSLRDQFCHGSNAIARRTSEAAQGVYSAFHLLKHTHQARCELSLTQLVQGKHNPSEEYKLSLNLMKAVCLWHRNRGIFVENVGLEPLLPEDEVSEGSGGDQSNDQLRLFLLEYYSNSPPLSLSGPFCVECERLIVYDRKSALGQAADDAATAARSVVQGGCDHAALALAATAALVPDSVLEGGVSLVVSTAEAAARLAGLL